ncbi:MAG: 16S rRNA (cytidine(1402)-2'-O)-methyltransferase [Emcibacteraceae bacterium]|jgi:16S rRNA (cytidine1402-2'-O)-methyltransferase|tara:strand:+ start:7547 stop:8398 length:852 start_codon:yes stop_codon:yes gene_type:complete
MIINIKKSFDKGLYVTATPIGNLGDISRRALDLFGSADFIICEDKRVSGKLLSYYEIKTPMISYHDHNSQAVMPKLIDELKAGKTMALITDAGTPLISDPGYKLVNECRNQGIMVTSLPGASAVLCALTCAGMATDKFFFSGFLPSKTVARKKEINKLSKIPATLVYFESPKRLLASLKDLREVLGNRNAAVCRELTKLYEEIRKDNLDNLIEHYEGLQTPKGEIVVLIEQGKEKKLVNDLDSALDDALKKLSVKEAVFAVTYMTGRKRKEVYKRALELSGND